MTLLIWAKIAREIYYLQIFFLLFLRVDAAIGGRCVDVVLRERREGCSQ